MFDFDHRFSRETKQKIRRSFRESPLSDHVDATENCKVVAAYVIDDEPVLYGICGGDWEEPAGFFFYGNEIHVPERQGKFPAFPDFEGKKEKVADRSEKVRERSVDTFSLNPAP